MLSIQPIARNNLLLLSPMHHSSCRPPWCFLFCSLLQYSNCSVTHQKNPRNCAQQFGLPSEEAGEGVGCCCQTDLHQFLGYGLFRAMSCYTLCNYSLWSHYYCRNGLVWLSLCASWSAAAATSEVALRMCMPPVCVSVCVLVCVC